MTNTNNHTEKSGISRRTTTSNNHADYSHSHVPITCQSHVNTTIITYNTKHIQWYLTRVVVTTKVQTSHDTHSTSDSPERCVVQRYSGDSSRMRWAQSTTTASELDVRRRTTRQVDRQQHTGVTSQPPTRNNSGVASSRSDNRNNTNTGITPNRRHQLQLRH